MDEFKTIELFGCKAIILNGRIEVSVPNDDIGSKFVMHYSKKILDKKISSMLIRLPTKVVNITAQDEEHLIFKADHRIEN